MPLYKAFAKIASLTMVSRITGFMRDMLHTSILGASFVSDAFIIAFKFPNFFRRLFGEGAFNAAFIPLFSSMAASKGKEEALKFAAQSLALLSLVLIVIVGLAEIFMPYVMMMLAPGFVDEPTRFAAAIDFGRITFPYLFFICLAALYGGVLNSFNHFTIGAAAPILLNLTMIAGLLIYRHDQLSAGYAVSVAVSIAGVLQLAWMIRATHQKDLKIDYVLPRLTPQTKMLLYKMGPVALSSSIFQVNLMVDIILASFLPKGSVSYLYFADRLSELPLGVIGVTIGTALLPMLSKHVELKEKQESFKMQNKSMLAGMLLALPAAVALFVIADPIIRVLFGRGAFGEVDIAATSTTLMAYAVGVPAFVLNKIFTTSFFAHKDTKMPFKIGVYTILLNFCLNLILMQYLAHVGLALSTTIAAWVQAIVSYIILYKRDWYRLDRPTLKKLVGFSVASLIMAAMLMFNHHQQIVTNKYMMVSFDVIAGLVVYLVSAMLISGVKWRELKMQLRG